MVELLNPNRAPLAKIFHQEFEGMTFTDVSLDNLIETREILINRINTILSETDKKFLLSVKSGGPDWMLFPVSNISELPAVKWKLSNIRKMSEDKHQQAYQKLKYHLGL
ncbi:MAG: hypothetical protein M0R34_09995 [Candidatus Marinimicrobia bacterium]|jgi:hypothetical protein|nr:hypothetical protein [Candidatus Neomarinimicrobiota bacterium]MCK9560189.1 hypothetical protein [Candidatus Neomarinimicrobiota bacterium]